MIEWFESIAGPAYAPALMWTALALLALLLVLVAVKVFRSLGSGTFIAGGRNRKARLAVLDATAIDNQRRLVLVRRDDVEHLILIGGANDLVVEREIRAFEEAHVEAEQRSSASHDAMVQASERPAPEPRAVSPSVPQPPAPTPRPAAPSRPAATDNAPVAPAAPPVSAPPVAAASRPTQPLAPVQKEPRFDKPADAPAPQTQRPPQEPAIAAPSPSPASTSAPEPARREPAAPASFRPATAGATAAGAAGQKPQARQDVDLDDALLEELELTLEDDDRRPNAAEPAIRRDPNLDDEMDRLLGELSSERR
ncbi:MAG: hypothetical protein ACXIVF_15905 [Rhizobiaceae bacterium]